MRAARAKLRILELPVANRGRGLAPRWVILPVVLILCLFSLSAHARDLVVYGEPTLKPVLTSLGALWRAKGNSAEHVFVAPTDLSFEQIARETRCDVVFALAGPVTDAAEERELFDADSRIHAFGNSLVLVVRAASATAPGAPRVVLVAIFGGFAPFIATWLIAKTGSPISPTYYVIAAAAVSAAVILGLHETAHEKLR